MGCIFFHFGWLRKKNAQKNTSESSLFFLLPSVSQCYPTKFFFQHGMTKNFPPILFCTWGEWNISKVMRLCVHPVGSAWRGRWKSFGWPGGRLQQDVHGVFSLSGWFFWRFIACIFSGWDVHWLMYLKNLPKYTLLRVIYIYISVGHIQEPWYLFSKTTWASTWVSVWTSCAFWRCFDPKKWVFFSVLVSSSLLFSSLRKIHEKSCSCFFCLAERQMS